MEPNDCQPYIPEPIVAPVIPATLDATPADAIAPTAFELIEDINMDNHHDQRSHHSYYDGCHDDKINVPSQIERLGLANLRATDDVGKEVCDSSRSVLQAIDSHGVHNDDVTRGVGDNLGAAIDRSGIAGVAATAAQGAEGRAVTERFGFQNLGATQRGSDLGIAATTDAKNAVEEYGYKGVVATKDAEKDVLGAICDSGAGLSEAAREILMSQSGGFKDVYLQAAQNAKDMLMSGSANTKDILLQSASNTASIRDDICDSTKQVLLQSANEFKDVLLQASGNAASIRADVAAGIKDVQMQVCESTDNIKEQSASQFKDLLLQNAAIAKDAAIAAALNAKDAEISRVVFAKDAALAAAVNYEKLSAQGDRNTASIQATAMDNACKLAAEIAECCCETQKLVIEKASQTDLLIRSVDQDRVKEALADAKLEILALKNKCCDDKKRD